MWLSAALLHCDDAAAAAHEQAQNADCGYPAEHAPAGSGSYKTAACLVADEPTPASAARLAAPIGGNLSLSVLHVSSTYFLVPPRSGPAFQPAYRAAPAAAVFLRSSRLLI